MRWLVEGWKRRIVAFGNGGNVWENPTVFGDEGVAATNFAEVSLTL